MSTEQIFLQELNIFRSEIESAIRYIYTEGAIHEMARKNKKVIAALNKNPSFWNSILGALTVSMFIAFGRIFDTSNETGQKHSIHTLFKLANENRNIFSKSEFTKRWTISHPDMLSFKNEYLKSFYEMNDSDWKKVKRLKAALNKQYQEIYKPIRNMFGHRIIIDNEQTKLIMSKAIMREVEKFCTNLKQFHEALWQLYHNGRGPIAPLRTGKYSSKEFVKVKYESYEPWPLSYRYVESAREALLLVVKGNTPDKK